MKKTMIALTALVAILFSVNTALAKNNKSSNGQPFNEIWKAITEIRAQIAAHTHTGGSTGPQGPQGERGISGAGAVAFIDSNDEATSTVSVLKTNGQVWSRIEGGIWVNDNMLIPTTSSAVVQWNSNSYLDILGNVWQWNGSAWVNVSHP